MPRNTAQSPGDRFACVALAQGFAIAGAGSCIAACPLAMMRFTFLVLASVQATQVSPVQKVIELLDELKAKVAGDLSAEETMMEEYTKWCDEEENDKEDAITSNKRTVGDLNTVITDSNARIGELSSEIEELAGKISAADADLKEATGIRDE